MGPVGVAGFGGSEERRVDAAPRQPEALTCPGRQHGGASSGATRPCPASAGANSKIHRPPTAVRTGHRGAAGTRALRDIALRPHASSGACGVYAVAGHRSGWDPRPSRHSSSATRIIRGVSEANMSLVSLALVALGGALAEAASNPLQCAAVSDRVDCSSGNTELSQADCLARQCCWHAPSSGERAEQPDECITGTVDTKGVVGTNDWSQHVEFGSGKTIDGVPVAAEIMGYVHTGKHGGPGPCCGNHFTVTTANITSTGFDLTVVRTDPKAVKGWVRRFAYFCLAFSHLYPTCILSSLR